MPHFIGSVQNSVEATQWYPGQRVVGVEGEAASHAGGNGLLPNPPHAYLATPRGRITVFAGDWVITELGGAQHVYPDSLFRQHYAPAEEIEPTT